MTKLAKVSGNVEFVHDERWVLLKQTYDCVGQCLMVLEGNHFEEEDFIYSSTLFVDYIFFAKFFRKSAKISRIISALNPLPNRLFYQVRVVAFLVPG